MLFVERWSQSLVTGRNLQGEAYAVLEVLRSFSGVAFVPCSLDPDGPQKTSINSEISYYAWWGGTLERKSLVSTGTGRGLRALEHEQSNWCVDDNGRR